MIDTRIAKIINCQQISLDIKNNIKHEINNNILEGKRQPCLAVIIIGDNPASLLYVHNKQKACAYVGMKSILMHYESNITESQIIEAIESLNNDVTIDGILVQLPLPQHLNKINIIDKISHNKDVDGFTRYNMGSLIINSATRSPCTALGVLHLLNFINFDYIGANAVIIGASNIVGRPMAIELLNKGATVTICNSKTRDLSIYTKNADLIIIAIGQARFLKSSLIKQNSVIIDVGINKLSDGSIIGDVDFEDVIDKVSYITTVPNGVGPMTIAMLIKNTFSCYLSNIIKI